MHKIVFLDRDGVINKYPGDKNYVTSWKGFKFLPYARSGLKKLTDAGYEIFVVSNQAGVTKGIFSKTSLNDITKRMLLKLKEDNINIGGVYYCIHRDEDRCACRKPKAGLLKKALSDHKIPKSALSRAFFIGDTQRDIQTGKNAGCKTILLFTGKEKFKDRTKLELKPDFMVLNLKKAADIILKNENKNSLRLCGRRPSILRRINP